MEPQVPNDTAPFLKKLYSLVSEPQLNEFVEWSEDGTFFVIRCHEEFAKQALPLKFKHSNYSGFTRQLQMYNFDRVAHFEDEHAFIHPSFQRDSPELLSSVVRRKWRDVQQEQQQHVARINPHPPAAAGGGTDGHQRFSLEDWVVVDRV